MGEACSYLVFTEDTVAIFDGFGDLPEPYSFYPRMKVTNRFAEVRLTDLVLESEIAKSLLHVNILEGIKTFGTVGHVRLEFPCWDVMFIYAEEEKTEEEYHDVEQLVESFLTLHGPEFVL